MYGHRCVRSARFARVAGYGCGMALICSAKGCSAGATWSLLWNNPRLHTPERRKTWLACDTHRDSLAEFLRARRFLRDVEPLEDQPDEPAHDLS
jgi:hypothetical protein